MYIEYRGTQFQESGAAGFFKRKGVTGRGEMQAVRIGHFAGLRYQIVDPKQPLRLYDLATDAHEDNNIARAAGSDTMLACMMPLLLTARERADGARRPYDDEWMPAIKAGRVSPGLEVMGYAGTWPWVPDAATLGSV